MFLPCLHRGLFKTDKVIGTAHLKLETLENHCDLREIIEVSADFQLTQMHMYSPDVSQQCVYVLL